jgi:ATP-dependent protease ClpP protease subunit
MSSDESTQAQPQQPQGPRYIFIGFNAQIDRNSIAKLLGVVGVIVERRPLPKAIVLGLSSEGGSMESAFYAFEILRALPMGIITHNLGLVASAANILFMAGNVRFASPHTAFLFHDTKLPIPAPATISQEELQLHIEGTRQSDIKCADIIAERIGKPAREVKRWFGEKLRTAEFAKERGIISEICPLAMTPMDTFVQVIL